MKPQVWVGDEDPDPEKFEPPEPSDEIVIGKPAGGLWTSTLIEKEDRISSGWIEWMRSEQYTMGTEAWILYPEDDVEVYVIDDVWDAKKVMKPVERYKDHPTLEEWEIDWESVFSEYDAINLTEKGQWETRFPNKTWVDGNGERQWGRRADNLDKYNLYGWDCESTLWGAWRFERVEYAGEVTIPPRESYGD